MLTYAQACRCAFSATLPSASIKSDGVVGLAFGGIPTSVQEADMIGEMDLDADFSAGTIRGEMDDFNTRDGRELQGELRVTDGRIDGSGFSGTARGTLTGGATAPGAVDDTIGGEFLGHGAPALAGSGAGTSAGGDVGLVFRGQRDRDRDEGHSAPCPRSASDLRPRLRVGAGCPAGPRTGPARVSAVRAVPDGGQRLDDGPHAFAAAGLPA